MESVKRLTFYTVFYVKYIQRYWVINHDMDIMDGEAKSLPEALALAEALDNSLKRFVMEDNNDGEGSDS